MAFIIKPILDIVCKSSLKWLLVPFMPIPLVIIPPMLFVWLGLGFYFHHQSAHPFLNTNSAGTVTYGRSFLMAFLIVYCVVMLLCILAVALGCKVEGLVPSIGNFERMGAKAALGGGGRALMAEASHLVPPGGVGGLAAAAQAARFAAPGGFSSAIVQQAQQLAAQGQFGGLAAQMAAHPGFGPMMTQAARTYMTGAAPGGFGQYLAGQAQQMASQGQFGALASQVVSHPGWQPFVAQLQAGLPAAPH